MATGAAGGSQTITSEPAPSAAPVSRAGPTARPSLWTGLVFLPLALAAAYAGARALFPARPTLAEMVPANAALVWRYADLSAYDDARRGTTAGGEAAAEPSAVLGAEVNLPRLAGVDRRRPLLDVLLRAGGRPDPRLVVLPVGDAAAVVSTFRDPDLAERHARHVVVHGPWLAASADLDAARRAGEGGGPWPAERGERLAAAADWPVLVDLLLRPDQAADGTVAPLLRALGFDLATARSVDPGSEGAGGTRVAVVAGRVPLVRAAWTRVELFAFADAMRFDFVPAKHEDVAAALEGTYADAFADRPAAAEVFDLRAALRAAAAAGDAPADDVPFLPGAGAAARLHLHGGAARHATALALLYAGVRFPVEALANGAAALRLRAPGGLDLVARDAASGVRPSWTLAIAGTADALPSLAGFRLADAQIGAPRDLAEGAAPLLVPFGGASPPAEVARRSWALAPAGVDVVVAGVGAAGVAGAAAGSAPETAPAPVAGPGRAAGERLVRIATLRLSFGAARGLLGPALEERGLLLPLAAADLEGALLTDGERLVLELRRARP